MSMINTYIVKYVNDETAVMVTVRKAEEVLMDRNVIEVRTATHSYTKQELKLSELLPVDEAVAEMERMMAEREAEKRRNAEVTAKILAEREGK